MKRLQKGILYSIDAFVFTWQASLTQFWRILGGLVAGESRKDSEVIETVPSDDEVCSDKANFPSPNLLYLSRVKIIEKRNL